jgi:hypothetical protein
MRRGRFYVFVRSPERSFPPSTEVGRRRAAWIYKRVFAHHRRMTSLTCPTGGNDA